MNAGTVRCLASDSFSRERGPGHWDNRISSHWTWLAVSRVSQTAIPREGSHGAWGSATTTDQPTSLRTAAAGRWGRRHLCLSARRASRHWWAVASAGPSSDP
jgi:hypothetical protein